MLAVIVHRTSPTGSLQSLAVIDLRRRKEVFREYALLYRLDNEEFMFWHKSSLCFKVLNSTQKLYKVYSFDFKSKTLQSHLQLSSAQYLNTETSIPYINPSGSLSALISTKSDPLHPSHQYFALFSLTATHKPHIDYRLQPMHASVMIACADGRRLVVGCRNPWIDDRGSKVIGMEYSTTDMRFVRKLIVGSGERCYERFLQGKGTRWPFSQLKDQKSGKAGIREWRLGEKSEVVYDIQAALFTEMRGNEDDVYAIQAEGIWKLNRKKLRAESFASLFEFKQKHLLEISVCGSFFIIANGNNLYSINMSNKKVWLLNDFDFDFSNSQIQDNSNRIYAVTRDSLKIIQLSETSASIISTIPLTLPFPILISVSSPGIAYFSAQSSTPASRDLVILDTSTHTISRTALPAINTYAGIQYMPHIHSCILLGMTPVIVDCHGLSYSHLAMTCMLDDHLSCLPELCCSEMSKDY